MLQAGRARDRFPMRSLNFLIDLILPATLWPWFDSASNRNEYQAFTWGLKGGWCVRLTTSQPSVSQLSRKCGNLDVSQTYVDSWSVKRDKKMSTAVGIHFAVRTERQPIRTKELLVIGVSQVIIFSKLTQKQHGIRMICFQAIATIVYHCAWCTTSLKGYSISISWNVFHVNLRLLIFYPSH
jgi:hypothetical protein